MSPTVTAELMLLAKFRSFESWHGWRRHRPVSEVLLTLTTLRLQSPWAAAHLNDRCRRPRVHARDPKGDFRHRGKLSLTVRQSGERRGTRPPVLRVSAPAQVAAHEGMSGHTVRDDGGRHGPEGQRDQGVCEVRLYSLA